jgi:hypothetical protein
MSVDVFHDSTKTVPKSDPRIIAQDYDKQDMGARKSALPKLTRNGMTIAHIKGS